MSEQTWMDEFYPTPAVGSAGSDKEAALHSLQKWMGALPHNLERHGLKAPPIDFSSETCSLCARHLSSRGSCAECPLLKVESIDGTRGCWSGSAFHRYSDTGDPSEMIGLLSKASLLERAKPTREERIGAAIDIAETWRDQLDYGVEPDHYLIYAPARAATHQCEYRETEGFDPEVLFNGLYVMVPVFIPARAIERKLEG